MCCDVVVALMMLVGLDSDLSRRLGDCVTIEGSKGRVYCLIIWLEVCGDSSTAGNGAVTRGAGVGVLVVNAVAGGDLIRSGSSYAIVAKEIVGLGLVNFGGDFRIVAGGGAGDGWCCACSAGGADDVVGVSCAAT